SMAMARSAKIFRRCVRPALNRQIPAVETKKPVKNRLLCWICAAIPDVGGLNFRERLDTLGTQVPAHQFAIFIDANLLNVRQLLPPSRPDRVPAHVAKHRFFAAISANRHDFASNVLKLAYLMLRMLP